MASLKQIDQLAAPIECWRNVTLTYRRRDVEPSEANRDLKRLCDSLRRKFPAVAFEWAVEAQTRGTPHYHILLYAPRGHDLNAGGVLHLALMGKWNEIAEKGDERHLWVHTQKRERHVEDHYQVDAWERIESWDQLQRYLVAYISSDNPAWEGVRTWGIHNRDAFPRFEDVDELTDDQTKLLTRDLRRLMVHRPSGKKSVTLNVNGRPAFKYYWHRGKAWGCCCGENSRKNFRAWVDPQYVLRLIKEKAGEVRHYRRKWKIRTGSAVNVFVDHHTLYRFMASAIKRAPAKPHDQLLDQAAAQDALNAFCETLDVETKARRRRRDNWKDLLWSMKRRRNDEALAAASGWIAPSKSPSSDPRDKPVAVIPQALRDLQGEIAHPYRHAPDARAQRDNATIGTGSGGGQVCKSERSEKVLPVISR